jgi:hypothetical protein
MLIPRPVFLASGLTTLLAEWRLDHDYRRFGLMATAPFLVCVSLVRLVLFSLSFFILPFKSSNADMVWDIVLCAPGHQLDYLLVRSLPLSSSYQ